MLCCVHQKNWQQCLAVDFHRGEIVRATSPLLLGFGKEETACHERRLMTEVSFQKIERNDGTMLAVLMICNAYIAYIELKKNFMLEDLQGFFLVFAK